MIDTTGLGILKLIEYTAKGLGAVATLAGKFDKSPVTTPQKSTESAKKAVKAQRGDANINTIKAPISSAQTFSKLGLLSTEKDKSSRGGVAPKSPGMKK